MQTPLQITFRHMPPSPALEARCRAEAAKLERYHRSIIGCKVTLGVPHQHHHEGNLHEVRLEVVVPGGEIVVTREPPAHHAGEDPLVAVREAFDSMRRRLEDHARRQRGAVKVHEQPLHGRVKELWPEHGFLTTPRGDEVYFHRHSVVGSAFEQLEVGHEVRYVEEQGERGLQATSVERVGRHHHQVP